MTFRLDSTPHRLHDSTTRLILLFMTETFLGVSELFDVVSMVGSKRHILEEMVVFFSYLCPFEEIFKKGVTFPVNTPQRARTSTKNMYWALLLYRCNYSPGKPKPEHNSNKRTPYLHAVYFTTLKLETGINNL